MRTNKITFILAALVLLALVTAGCTRPDARRQAEEWTPPPVRGSLVIGTRAPDVLPTLPPPTRRVQTPAAVPTRLAATAVPRAEPTATPTRDPNLVIITEEDVLRAVTSGTTEENGATLEDVGVQFTADGKMILTAGRLGYGFISADNVVLVGRLIAVGGKLQLETESISPRGLVTSFIPTLANEALQQYTSRWYVDSVQTLEGRIEMRVRTQGS